MHKVYADKENFCAGHYSYHISAKLDKNYHIIRNNNYINSKSEMISLN